MSETEISIKEKTKMAKTIDFLKAMGIPGSAKEKILCLEEPGIVTAACRLDRKTRGKNYGRISKSAEYR
jgi:hypothetical protein